MKECVICGRPNAELHHRIFRSECKPLEKCKKNHVYLCPIHHRDHRQGVHFDKDLNRKIRLEFQNWLEFTFLKKEYTAEEIAEILDISLNATERLLKTIRHNRYKYSREDVIRVCMAGKIILEGEDDETVMESI